MKKSSLPRTFGLLFLWLVLSANYLTNFAGIAEQSTFENWQINGQARILGGIHADRIGLWKDGAHMGKLWPSALGPTDWTQQSTHETYRIFANPESVDDLIYEHYRSQYGLHEVAYSALSRTFGLDTLVELQAVPAVLTAATVVLLFSAFLRLYGKWFATLFLLSLAAAPLFLTMARNLYWSPFLLLLPALAAAWLHESSTTRARLWCLGLVWSAMLLKCLSNYEYITTVTLLACSTPLVAPLFADPANGRPDFRWAGAVFLACVAAFGVAFLVHAGSRGDGLMDGIRTIYLEDIARRTYGDASAFTGEAADSLRASPLDVLRIYLFDYPGKRTMIVPGKAFLAMIAFSLISIPLRFWLRDAKARRDAWMLVAFFAVPASWYVLAKGHSYTQTHINFVLWYIGFMPALIFAAGSSCIALLRRALAWLGRKPQFAATR